MAISEAIISRVVPSWNEIK